MKSVVVECPKGVYTRLMPGSLAIELYHEWKKNPNQRRIKSGPPNAQEKFATHMENLHKKFLKEQGEI